MKLLLLVQNETDVAHLDAAANSILASAITGVWVVFSPAITVNASEASAKLDTEIEQLRAAELQAAQRADYEAAAGYKGQREGKELDKAKALRDAWKTAPEEDRKAKVNSIFKPFLGALQSKGGMNVRVTGHSDHYDREQWVAMLNSLSGVWFKPFTPGSFVVAWPESVETAIEATPSAVQTPSAERMSSKIEKAQAAQSTPPSTKDGRRAELTEMHGMKRRVLGKNLGLDVDKLTPAELIDAIIEAESKPAAELAEY